MSSTSLALVSAIAESALVRFQETAVEIIAGPGGPILLSVGILGIALLAFEVLLLMVRVARRSLDRRKPISTPADRARGLASLGAAPAEISRATGLPRDVLTLVAPDAVSPRTKLPAAALSAAHSASPAPPAAVATALEVVVKAEVEVAVPAASKPAHPLPSIHRGNANSPFFGAAA
jgi:hypothetical protein